MIPPLHRIALLAGAAAGAAHAQVIDFNNLPGPHNLLTSPYTEDGYSLTSLAAGQAAEINGFAPNGLLLRGTTAGPQVLRLENSGGSPFNLLSLLVGNNTNAGSTLLTASTGATRLILDPDIGLPLNLGAQWHNLAWVDIRVANSAAGAPGQFTGDNITLQTVPAPGATLALAAAALAAIPRRRR